MTDSLAIEKLILDLHTIKAIKFGEFKLKSGIMSPYYMDLRLLVSYPHLLELVADVFWEKMRVLYFDIVVGVPYTALPISTVLVLKHTQSMVLLRKEKKDYGTGQMIEGEYHKGQIAVIVDDVITNGDSKLTTIKLLETNGIIVKDVVVLLDRGQGGPELLEKNAYTCHSIMNVEDVFRILLKYKRINAVIAKKCLDFTKKTRKEFLVENKKIAALKKD